MLQQIINAVQPIVVSALVAVITAIVGVVGTAAVHFINTKKAALIAKIGADKYNNDLAVAREIYGIVDEHYRINPQLTKTVQTAAAKFEQEILKKIPGLTSEEIEHLRQAVAGEVNKGKEAIKAPVAPVADAPQSPVPQQAITVNVSAPTTASPAEVAQKVTEAMKQTAMIQ